MNAVKIEHYGAYKDSGAKLIGTVPENWKIVRLKDLGFLQNGISESGDYFGYGFPFISYGNVYNNTISSEKIKTFANSTIDDQHVYSCKRGDVFFTRTSETIEEIGFSATCLETIPNSVFSGFVIRFRQTSIKLTPEFSKFYFSANIHRAFFCREVAIVTRASLGQGLLNRLTVLLPPPEEQVAIASYLEIKTTQINYKIDCLEKKVRQYEKLKKSLINETVTRGLVKNIEMKDSGVYWIGEIPQHWAILRLKDISSIKKGEVFDFSAEEGEVPYLNGGMNPSGYSNKSNFPEGVIAVSEGGASSGYAQFMDIPFWCGAHCYAISPKTKCKKYLFYCIKGYEHVLSELKTGSAMPNLKKSEISNFSIPISKSYEEQKSIVAYLDSETTKIDHIVTAIATQIKNLKNLRNSLINDVVTGKIKVLGEGK
jgi:type I restriction enzyme, S subunit